MDQSTTVLQINEHESCWDVLCKICEKKSLKPGLCSLSLSKPNEQNNNSAEKTNFLNVEKNFFSFNCNTIYLIEGKDEEDRFTNSRSSSRRSSTMVAPSSRKTTVRLDSQSFPKTIEVQEPPENDTTSINSEKTKFDFSMKRGSKMFGFFLKGHKKVGSDSSSILCASPSQSASISRQQSGINDNMENDLSGFNKNSNMVINEKIPLDNAELFRKISNNVEKNNRNDILKRSMSDLGSGLLKESKEELNSSEIKLEEKEGFPKTNPTGPNMSFSPEVDPVINNLKSLLSVPPSSSSPSPVPSDNDKNNKDNNNSEDGIAELPATKPKAKGR